MCYVQNTCDHCVDMTFCPGPLPEEGKLGQIAGGKCFLWVVWGETISGQMSLLLIEMECGASVFQKQFVKVGVQILFNCMTDRFLLSSVRAVPLLTDVSVARFSLLSVFLLFSCSFPTLLLQLYV